MSKKRKRKAEEPELTDSATIEFWNALRGELGIQSVFIDSCVILSCLVPEDEHYRKFLKNELSGYRLYTSSHVVAETVRRLAKRSNPYPFIGPQRQIDHDLAGYVVETWLSQHNIRIVSVPEAVFDRARLEYIRYRDVDGWDLVDALSLQMIRAMEQERIVSADKGFLNFGIILMPSNAWELYKGRRDWMFK